MKKNQFANKPIPFSVGGKNKSEIFLLMCVIRNQITRIPPATVHILQSFRGIMCM